MGVTREGLAVGKHRRRTIWAVSLSILVAGLAVGVAGFAGVLQPTAAMPSPSPSPSPEPLPQAPEFPGIVENTDPVVFTAVFAGDILPHGSLVTSSERTSWATIFEKPTPWIAGADLGICHLESPVAPPGTSPSGYPRFAAPAALITGIRDSGWDGCSTASNHTVDQGMKGVIATLEEFDNHKLGVSGSARSQQEYESPQLYTVVAAGRQITVANISFSYGTNGLPKPGGNAWTVNTFNAGASNVDPILKRAQEARDMGADIVIASVHCCVEYRTQPTAAQQLTAQRIANSGLVDLYVGHHAHVPQPIVKLDGGPNGDGMWVAYGLGNFVSNQSSHCCSANTSNGILMTATFSVDVDGVVDVGVEWTATTVDRGNRHKMYILSDVPNGAGSLSASQVSDRYRRVREAVGTAAPERTEPAEKHAIVVYPLPRDA